MKNILFIADNNHYRLWPGKTYYDLITHVSRQSTQHKITIFWTDDDREVIMQYIRDEKPELILFFITGCMEVECKNFMDLFSMNIPTACAMLDMFFPYYGKTDYVCPGSLIHIGKNKEIVACYQSFFPDKYITSFSSRFINTARFKDYKLEKKYDILIYGSRTFNYPFKKEPLPSIQRFLKQYEERHNVVVEEHTLINFYYLRKRIETILETCGDKYRIKVLPESGIYNSDIANESLSMLINQSHLTIACATLADVMMHKYLEIAASNSVILGNVPSDYVDLFRGNMIEITEFMSDDAILEKIDNALANPVMLKSMSARLYERVHAEHNLDCAVDNMTDVINEICSYNQNK